MDEKSMRVLEFDKVTALLADKTSFSLGREAALKTRPLHDINAVNRALQETSEAYFVLTHSGDIPFGGIHDIRASLRRARVGGTLGAEQLLEIGDTLRGSRRLRRFLWQNLTHPQLQGEETPPWKSGPSFLLTRTSQITVVEETEREIFHCIDDDGHVADWASSELARLRTQIRTLQKRVRDKMDSIIKSRAAQRLLQEPLVTLRNGRFVVPVKQEHRAAIPGIVHDQSSSGATVFVEPIEVVEINNKLRELENDEKREVERILSRLSSMVARDADALITTMEVVAELDCIVAKAQLAMDYDGVPPRFNTDGWIDLVAARHPLLTGNVVPISVWIGRDFNALVVTGPNTGGKTVTLKTVGLLTLMGEAGLFVPAADRSELCVFDSIYADIGDEQSIEQSLSTFSSHMTNIVRILGLVTEKSLVLLDELGAGTDPNEGAALAMALIDHLLKVNCRTMATTHYSELKTFAYTHLQVENASVEFDVKTLRPTYHLSVGLAGRSNAFEIAARLGLDATIISGARDRLSREDLKVEDMIQEVEHNSRIARRERARAEELYREASTLKTRYDEKLTRLREQTDDLKREAQEEARHILKQAKADADALLGQLRKLGSVEGDFESVARDVRESLQGQLSGLEKELQDHDQDAESLASPPTVQVGDQVRIRSVNQVGEALTKPDDRGDVVIQAGVMRVTVPVADLEIVGRRSEASRPRSHQLSSGIAKAKAQTISPELDVRGMRVEEALARIDKYVDDCLLADLRKAVIIHGKGTGALRRAVQDLLQNDRKVAQFRLGGPGEGGTGVTVVEFS